MMATLSGNLSSGHRNPSASSFSVRSVRFLNHRSEPRLLTSTAFVWQEPNNYELEARKATFSPSVSSGCESSSGDKDLVPGTADRILRGSSSNPALRFRRYGFQLRPGSGSSVNSGPFTISGRLIALMGLASGPWITAVKILPSRKMGPFTFKKAHWADQTGV